MSRLANPRLTRIACMLDEDVLLLEDEVLSQMITAGMDIAFINLHSSNYSLYMSIINRLYNLTADMGTIIAIIVNLRGSQQTLRTSESLSVRVGDMLAISMENMDDGPRLSNPPDPVEIGAQIQIGKSIFGVIQSVSPSHISVEIQSGGEVADYSRVCINGSSVIESMVAQQAQEFDWALESNVDFVSYAFSEEKWQEELREIQSLRKKKQTIKIFCMIEHVFSEEILQILIEGTNGVILSRCPLAAEMPIEKISTFQRDVSKIARLRGKPLIVTGHVLSSLKTLPFALRADACDVYNGVLDCIDGFILNSEILQEEVWERSLTTIDEIIRTAEREVNYKAKFQEAWNAAATPTIPEAVASSAVKMCIELSAQLIVCIVHTGHLSRLVAKYRPPVPVVTLSNSLRVVQQCVVYRGSITALGPVSTFKHALKKVMDMCKLSLPPKSCVVVVNEDESCQVRVLTIQ